MKISIKDRFDIFLFGTGYKQDFREEKKVSNILILINVTGFIKTLGGCGAVQIFPFLSYA